MTGCSLIEGSEDDGMTLLSRCLGDLVFCE